MHAFHLTVSAAVLLVTTGFAVGQEGTDAEAAAFEEDAGQIQMQVIHSSKSYR